MAKNNTLVIGLVLVIIALLVFSAWGPLSEQLGLPSGADAGMSLTLFYADGTSRTVSTGTALTPLTIMDGGREVTRVHLQTFVTASYTGTVTVWEITGGSTQCWMNRADFVQVGSAVFDDLWGVETGSTWASGEEKHLFDRDLGASQIEQHLISAGQPAGRYQLKFDTSFAKLAVMFDDGSTDERSPNLYTISWEFDYTMSGINSVYLTVTSEPWF